MNIRPPRSIIILFAGMAAIAIGANFLKGMGADDEVRIAPSVAALPSEQTPVATSSPAAPTTTPAVTPSITPRHEREFWEDE